MEISVSICVQHHPKRADLLADLRKQVDFELVTDPDPDAEPNPLRCYLECLRRTPENATHRIVLQDDSWPCNGFEKLAQEAIAERPNALIAFYVPDVGGGGGNRVMEARMERESWALLGLGGWVPVVALAWPADMAFGFLDYLERGLLGVPSRSDDDVVTRYCRRARVHVWATVPSLVDHPDDVPSLIGRPHGAGEIRWRVAAYFRDRD